MSVTLSRNVVLEDLQLAAKLSFDEQGKETYSAPVTIQGHVVREDLVVMLPSGENARSNATIWIPGTTSPLPATDDRLTLGSGADTLVGIVIERAEVRTLKAELDHVRVRIREE